MIDRSRPSALQWRVTSLCAMVAILDGFDTQAIAFVAPVIAHELNVDSTAFGLETFAAGNRAFRITHTSLDL